jgi:4-hydroxyphenylacetate 3-monooxygenase
VLASIDDRVANNIDRDIPAVTKNNIFHVSANTDPKGDGSRAPRDQDRDLMVHVVTETEAGIVIRDAKYQTAA